MDEDQDQTKKEVCTIRIVFPVVTDEQAIECKHKVAEALRDIPNVQTHFSLMPLPSRPPGV